MAINLCPQCKTPNRASARFCSECGEPLISGLPVKSSSKTTANNEGITHSGPAQANKGNNPVENILMGRYRLESELGRGGFGAVYQAWDLNINRPCAVKENLDPSAEAARQFAREASVLANLSHTNLPRVTDHFSIPAIGQYLVMDFVDGEDLATIIERQQTVPIQQALEWVGQVADALEYLHEQKPPVLHRDIKPANIRITTNNRAMLVDFGLVKLFSPGLETTLGARAVTPGYSPPEQYGSGKTDVRTDIYALAATLYHMITGVEPLESVQRVCDEAMRTANQINMEIPISLSQVIERSLSLDPANRFQSVSEFHKALIASLEARADIIQPQKSSVVKRYAAQSVSPEVKIPSKSQNLQSKPHPSQLQSRPASQPIRSTKNIWIPVSLLGLVIILCVVAALVTGGLLLTSGPSKAEITETVQMQQTLSAGTRATSTYIYQIQATQTAISKPSP